MKKQNINQFDIKEEEIAYALISLGLGRAVARTLAFLNDGEEATSVALEQGSGLHQPEVSHEAVKGTGLDKRAGGEKTRKRQTI